MEHGEAFRCLGRYLKGTRTRGNSLILNPKRGKRLEVNADANFAGN